MASLPLFAMRAREVTRKGDIDGLYMFFSALQRGLGWLLPNGSTYRNP